MLTRFMSVRLVFIALVAVMTVAVSPATAQQGSAPAQEPALTTPAAVAAAPTRITLLPGRSTVLATDFNVVRIALTDPRIADAVVVQPKSILIDGHLPGTVSLIIWGETETRQYDVVVEAGATELQTRLRTLFPGEAINVSTNDEALILSGRVSTNQVSLRAAEIAAATSTKMKVVNLLQLPGGSPSQQVMLQVRFAEVSRRALTELGSSFFTGPRGYHDWVGRVTTQQYAAPDFAGSIGPVPGSAEQGQMTFSDFLNLFVFNTKYHVGAVVRALQDKGMFQSLAEPNLIAYNGREASFLAGGEIPIPVVQGIMNAVTIQWKEFGVRLRFTPTIAGDTIRLKVSPEVSSLDYANGIMLNGFRIPAVTSRRADTEVELRDGQSFAIAGLLDQMMQNQTAGIPLLSRIPIIGYLFQSTRAKKERTELLVLITPKLVRPLEPSEVPPLPTDPTKFLQPPAAPGAELKGGGGVVDAPTVTIPRTPDSDFQGGER